MFKQYNTWKEIWQQPQMWMKTYDIVCSRKDEIATFLNRYLADDYEIVLTGAGTSAYIGNALEKALTDTCFRGARAIATTDIITDATTYFSSDSKVLLISFARSGNSPESVGAINLVNKTAGSVAHLFITCNADGSMVKMAQTGADNILCLLLPPETNDLSLAMTSSYSSMLLACAMVANIDNIEADEQKIKVLSKAVDDMLVRYSESLAAIAGRDFKRAVFLGTGELMGVAEESRLKLQELTDGTVMCAFDSYLGFRHGPKAVVNKDTLMVYLVSGKEAVRRYEYDLIRQIKANNSLCGYVAVSQNPLDIDSSYFDLNVVTGASDAECSSYSCVAYVVVAQLLGFYKAIALKRCPDNPSVSGNISRVVEGVTIYE